MTTHTSTIHTSTIDAQLTIQQKAFAKSLSPRSNGVFVISPDNHIEERTAWRDDLRDRPYAVSVGFGGRFYTLALDFDAKGEGTAASAAAHAETSQKILAMVGIEPVVVSSGPGGGRHVLATIDGGLTPKVMRRLIERFQYLGLDTLDPSPMLNVKTGSIRPPLSAHRSGGRSEPISHGIDEALLLLQAPQAAERFELLAYALPSQPAARPLRAPAGSTESRPSASALRSYQTGSEEVFAIAASLINRGEDIKGFESAVRQRAKESAAVAASLSKQENGGELDRWLRRAWRMAEERVRDNPAQNQRSTKEDLATVQAWGTHLGGLESKAGLRCAAVLHAEAVRRNRAVVGMSYRQIAEEANVTLSTARRGLLWLVKERVIEIADRGDAQRARRYRLVHPDSWQRDTGGTVSPTALGGVRSLTVPRLSPVSRMAEDITLDIWSAAGLGETGRQTFLALTVAVDDRGAAHIESLCERLAITRRSVERRLKTLSDAGLARRLGPGRWVAEYQEPVDLADRVGGAGHRQSIVARNRADRHAHRVRRTEQRVDWLVSKPRWRHLDPHIRGVLVEKHSQMTDIAIPITHTATIRIERPQHFQSPATMGALLSLPEYSAQDLGALN